MKTLYFIPLMFLAACSTTPKLTLRPQQPPSATDTSAIRYPEVVRAYHVGRYADPNDDLVMHEQHVIYRVEENDRWNLHPGPADMAQFNPSRDVAFSPTPVTADQLVRSLSSLAANGVCLETQTASSSRFLNSSSCSAGIMTEVNRKPSPSTRRRKRPSEFSLSIN